MSNQIARVGSWLVFLMLAATPSAMAQHEAHQPPTAPLPPAATACAKAQLAIQQLLDTANLRLEAVRQSNTAAAMRAAVDDMQSVLRNVRAQLEPCAALAAADEHTTHPPANATPPTAVPRPPAASKPPTPAPASRSNSQQP
jgi:hypothetical protein